MILRCANCQQDFTPRTELERCCSRKCGNRLYYLENRERIIKAAMEFAKNNPEQVLAYKRARYQRNRDELIQRQRDYRKQKAAERAQQRLTQQVGETK